MFSAKAVIIILLLAITVIYLLINARTFIAQLGLVAIVLVPLSYSKYFSGGIGGARGLALVNVIWLFVFLTIMLYIVATRQPLYLNKYFTLPLVLYFLVYLFGCVITFSNGINHPYFQFGNTTVDLVMQKVFRPIQYLITGWMIMALYKKEGYRAIIHRGILLSAVVLGVLTLFSYLSAGSLSGTSYQEGREAVKRIGIHPNSLGALCVYLYIFAVTLSDSQNRVLRAVAIGCSLLGILFSFSRIAWIVTVMISLFLFKKVKWNVRITALLLVCILALSFNDLIVSRARFGVDATLHSRSESRINKISAGRVSTIWVPGIRMFLEKPIFGYGIGSYVRTDSGLTPPHSAYLKTAIDLGVLGLLATISLFLYFWLKSRRVKGPFYYSLFAMLLLGTTGHMFYPYRGNYIFFVLYGLNVIMLSESLSPYKSLSTANG